MELNTRYGFLRPSECDVVDKVLDNLKSKFGYIAMCEVGVFGAGTTRGVYRRAQEIDCPVQLTGIDFEQYRPNPTPYPEYDFISEDSMDAWRGITKKYNFLFVDGCHCVNHSMCDFLNYSPFVVVGGYCMFHDTSLPTGKDKQEPWPQTDHSYAGKPPSVLGVREGLQKLGLLQGHRTDWELIEEVEGENGLMGAMLFRKLKEL